MTIRSTAEEDVIPGANNHAILLMAHRWIAHAGHRWRIRLWIKIIFFYRISLVNLCATSLSVLQIAGSEATCRRLQI